MQKTHRHGAWDGSSPEPPPRGGGEGPLRDWGPEAERGLRARAEGGAGQGREGSRWLPILSSSPAMGESKVVAGGHFGIFSQPAGHCSADNQEAVAAAAAVGAMTGGPAGGGGRRRRGGGGRGGRGGREED